MAGKLYSASFAAIAVTAAQDAFEIVAPSDKPVWINEIRLGQYTDFGDAASEIVSVLVVRGYTVTGSGGAAVTPAALQQGAPAASSVVARNNTTVANTGTAIQLIADVMNVQAGFFYAPPVDQRIALAPGERLVVRITAPADSLTMNGTLIFEEGRQL